MRATWDALAAAETEVYVGDPGSAERELDDLFARLCAVPAGGTCLEVGCGPGRMTAALAVRFDRVVAVDVSPAMVERARAAVGAGNVEFGVVSGQRLDGVGDGSSDALVCYLVLQHLPSRDVVVGYLHEFARVLAPAGEAFVQLPILDAGPRPRLWRLARSLLVPVVARVTRSPSSAAAFRGYRLARAELDRGLAAAGLRVVATDTGADAPYRHATDLFLRLRRP